MMQLSAVSMKLLSLVCFFTGLLSVIAGSLNPACGEDTLTTLEDEVVKTTIQAISDEGVITAPTLEELELDGLKRIERMPVTPASYSVTIDLVGGGRLLASSVIFEKDVFTLQGWCGGELKLPIDVVRGFRFGSKETAESKVETYQAAINDPSEENDRLFVKVSADEFQAVDGLIEKMSGEKITFQWSGASREIPLERIYGMVAAQIAPKKRRLGAYITAVNGSTIHGDLLGLTEGVLTVRLPDGTRLPIAWANVASLEIRSSRLLYLSDIEPDQEEQRALVTLGRKAMRDRAVAGGPLTLLKKTYSKGIGVHAHSELTFDLGGEYDTLVATIGIDDAAEGRGDCVFQVFADGRELYSQRVKGGEEPRPIKVPISDAALIKLVVLPGADLDLADHANWCDLKVVANKE